MKSSVKGSGAASLTQPVAALLGVGGGFLDEDAFRFHGFEADMAETGGACAWDAASDRAEAVRPRRASLLSQEGSEGY